ncbi:hypothetical protein BKA70DRAFT_1335050 [Coprinopsis sp. MPI-PUGE-AT-0042]|nr:hypothetical protein BKA70DRAFT_1335050 [Coprinopsis sp. MPI-PUGE-AT-0042]
MSSAFMASTSIHLTIVLIALCWLLVIEHSATLWFRTQSPFIDMCQRDLAGSCVSFAVGHERYSFPGRSTSELHAFVNKFLKSDTKTECPSQSNDLGSVEWAD